MKVLVMGGTRFFGIGTVKRLVEEGHDVTVATRGNAPDPFGNTVSRVIFDHRDAASIGKAFAGKSYDCVIDKIAFSSNDVKRVLDNVDCGRYILISTGGVYNRNFHTDIKEDEFDPYTYGLVWGERDTNGGTFDYDEGKRQAECAAVALKPGNAVTVRYPVIMGRNDYTGRLKFYVEHVMKNIPMNISNLPVKIGFMHECDAADLCADLINSDIRGPVNACSPDGITINDILGYIGRRTGCTAVIRDDGDPAPYNVFVNDTTFGTEKAEKHGFVFPGYDDWLWELIGYYIDLINGE